MNISKKRPMQNLLLLLGWTIGPFLFAPFFVALVAMVIGTQLFVTGFIAELISRNAPNRNAYLVEKRAGL